MAERKRQRYCVARVDSPEATLLEAAANQIPQDVHQQLADQDRCLDTDRESRPARVAFRSFQADQG